MRKNSGSLYQTMIIMISFDMILPTPSQLYYILAHSTYITYPNARRSGDAPGL